MPTGFAVYTYQSGCRKIRGCAPARIAYKFHSSVRHRTYGQCRSCDTPRPRLKSTSDSKLNCATKVALGIAGSKVSTGTSVRQCKQKPVRASLFTKRASSTRSLPKAPTGIQGLDEITAGGFPAGRPTLVCGSAGAGKTLLAMEFLVRGATEYNEPGVFMAFEETAAELTQNVRSLGFDLDELAKEKSSPLISSASSAARLTKPATTIWKDYSYGWAQPSTASAPSA